MTNIFSLWKKIYGNWRYTLSLILIALFFFILNIFIKNYNSIILNYKSLGFFGTLQFFYFLTIGFKGTVFLSTFIIVIIIGLLTGMLLTLIFYKVKALNTQKKVGFVGAFGIFIGIAAPGCAACGVGLLAVFGVTAAGLSILPFKGLEISLLAAAILLFSTWKVSKDLLKCKTCQIEIKNG